MYYDKYKYCVKIAETKHQVLATILHDGPDAPWSPATQVVDVESILELLTIDLGERETYAHEAIGK